MATDRPRVSVVVVTHNSRADIDPCLRSLVDDGSGLVDQVVVVDNASTDGTAAHVRSHWPAVRVVETGGNLGFSRANNVGIRATDGTLILLLNPDARLRAGTLEALWQALAADPAAAVAGPRLVDADGRAELSFGRMISPLREAWQKLLVTGHARRWPLVRAYVEAATTRPRRTDWVSGACLLVYRDVALAAGLLDERFFMYTEDVDFCAAVRRLGRTVLFVPEGVVTHLRGRSRRAAGTAADAGYRRSQIAFYAKHRPRWVPILRMYLRVRGRLPGPPPSTQGSDAG